MSSRHTLNLAVRSKQLAKPSDNWRVVPEEKAAKKKVQVRYSNFFAWIATPLVLLQATEA